MGCLGLVWYDLVIQLEWAKIRSDRVVLDDIIYVNFYPYTSSGSKYSWFHFSDEKTEWQLNLLVVIKID